MGLLDMIGTPVGAQLARTRFSLATVLGQRSSSLDPHPVFVRATNGEFQPVTPALLWKVSVPHETCAFFGPTIRVVYLK